VRLTGEILIAFVALYPVVTAGIWTAGGIVFRLLDEKVDLAPPAGGWPGVTLLVPAFNEESVIGTCVQRARAVDYPELEVLVLDDGSTDGTVDAATAAVEGDPRVEVVRDPVNRGKADRLNAGFARAQHGLVAVCDADTHLHPLALKLLVARISRSERIAAVAGAAHVTNRTGLLPALQSLEAASIIGLIRRTHSLTGRVGVVAGVLGLFRRDAVLGVGGYAGRMATEDIDLSWRLAFAGWQTAFEPHALVGMQVPTTLRALWAQRKRWARGQGEVLHLHLHRVWRWRHRRLWLMVHEALASLVWVLAFALSLVLGILATLFADAPTIFGLGLAWGIAIAAIAVVQLAFAVGIERRYDRRAVFAFLLGPLYPLGFWAISVAAALRAEVHAWISGPREERVVWDIPRAD
jgi:biofilm PGA synthesis N-glycosyltransferase PgaC